jgi:hypothetical protein
VGGTLKFASYNLTDRECYIDSILRLVAFRAQSVEVGSKFIL